MAVFSQEKRHSQKITTSHHQGICSRRRSAEKYERELGASQTSWRGGRATSLLRFDWKTSQSSAWDGTTFILHLRPKVQQRLRAFLRYFALLLLLRRFRALLCGDRTASIDPLSRPPNKIDTIASATSGSRGPRPVIRLEIAGTNIRCRTS